MQVCCGYMDDGVRFVMATRLIEGSHPRGKLAERHQKSAAHVSAMTQANIVH
jgi:hypothetical protein